MWRRFHTAATSNYTSSEEVIEVSSKSYSQCKRDKMDYRREYFRKNPGLFGCIWTCAYCHRPLVGKKNVQVDHIVPLNSILGRNASYNLVAACERCNKKKSDSVDGRIVVGYASKLIDTIIFTVQKIVVVAVVAVWTVIQKAVKALVWLLSKPFCGTGLIVKVLAALVYVTVVGLIVQKCV